MTHDAFGSGHPDHVRTHEVVRQAALAAGIEGVRPAAGRPWRAGAVYGAAYPRSESAVLDALLASVGKRLRTVTDDMAHVAVDVRAWLDRKNAAIMAHRSETEGARSLPRLLARLPASERNAVMATEYFTRLDPRYLPGPERLEGLTV
ncbi:PIG-L deacetylase family protein [Streptomyces lavendulae]|uniref:PIG-L deacetylase family protein n=1 Tax=Streptomyces lavendulae TaxID=1914 RepID=UPI0032DA31CE